MKRSFLVVFVLGCVCLVCVAGQNGTTVPTPSVVSPSVVNATAVTLEPTNTTTPEPATKQPITINTNNTARPTVIHTTKPSVIVPSYQVKNSDGKTCMLMEFIFDLEIAFKTKQNGSGNVKVDNVKLGAIATTGNCSGDDRTLLLTVSKYPDWQFRFEFAKQGKNGATFMLKKAIVQWKYEKPFFDNVDKFDEVEHVELEDLDIRAATGKTFKCDTRSQKKGPATFTMSNIMIQPYAQASSDKGKYGEEESCNAKPAGSSLSTGAIIGIVAGVLLVIVVVAGGVVFYCRNKKKSEYTSV